MRDQLSRARGNNPWSLIRGSLLYKKNKGIVNKMLKGVVPDFIFIIFSIMGTTLSTLIVCMLSLIMSALIIYLFNDNHD